MSAGQGKEKIWNCGKLLAYGRIFWNSEGQLNVLQKINMNIADLSSVAVML